MDKQEIFEYFIKEKSQFYSVDTLKYYPRHIKKFLDYCPKDIKDITEVDIISWLSHLKKEGNNENTRRLCLTILKTFFKFCVKKNIISSNPTLEISKIKVPQRDYFIITEEDFWILDEACKGHLRDRAMLNVFFYSGVRPQELINIKIEDIDFNDNTISILKGKGCKKRHVVFTSRCAVIIKEYLSTRNDDCPYLFINKFGKRFSTNRNTPLQRILDKYQQKIDFHQKVNCNILRHSFASNVDDKGLDIEHTASLMGHKYLYTTKIYLHNRTKRLNKIHKKHF
ncbi:MAG: hypothetical protein VR72_08500 [Clostridiaceae bacterium BRH_c20a]|nr:MAG: hypothetical protein VR72_08500 [Clostridiaceae bacterium BRH_c20a]